MKKSTLKELQEQLVSCEQLLKQIEDDIDHGDDDKITLIKGTKRLKVTYLELQQYSLEERYEFIHDMLNNSQISKEGELFQALLILNVFGFFDISRALRKGLVKSYICLGFKEEIISIKSQIAQREINSIGGKNRTSRHKNQALKIASDTWEVIPGASASSLSIKIHTHLNKFFTDVPEAGAIETWLSSSEDNPRITPKLKKYNLVIKD